MWRLQSVLLVGVWLVAALLAPIAHADDWPQWLGPQHDGIWRETGLMDHFPAGGPKVLWRTPVSGGYAGPAVAGGRVYVTDFTLKPEVVRPRDPFKRITQAGAERVICLEQATGKIVWTHAYDTAYSMSYSAGPRSTPVVDGDRVYTLGGEGDLACLDTRDGKEIWSKRMSDEKESPTPTWGFAAHPLIDADRLIVQTGGQNPAGGHGVVTAFDKQTGKVIWSALSSKEPGYSSPEIHEAGGVRQLICWIPESLNGLDPKTGKVLWSQPIGPAKLGLAVTTPRFHHDAELGDVLFVASQYEGSTLMKLDANQPKASVVWKRMGKSDRKSDALHSVWTMTWIYDGNIYGVDAYGALRCLDLKTGDRVWETFDATTYDAGEQKWAGALFVRLGETGGHFLIANEHGDLILANLDRAGYHEVSKAHLLEPTNSDPGRKVVWSPPACAGRCAFWRNDKELICVSMSN